MQSTAFVLRKLGTTFQGSLRLSGIVVCTSYGELKQKGLRFFLHLAVLPRTCRHRTEPTVLVSRMRCEYCVSVQLTVSRRKSWQQPNTN